MAREVVGDFEADRLAQQLALANALRDQGMQGNGGQGYHGGRVYMVGNQLGNIAKMLGGAYMAKQAQQGQQALGEQRQAQRAAFLQSMPSSSETVPVMGPTQDGGNLPDIVRLKNARQQADEMQRWSAGAANIPGLEGIANFGIQHAMSAPEKQADRELQGEIAKQNLLAKALEARQLQQERFDFQANQNAMYKRTADQLAAAVHGSRALPKDPEDIELDRELKRARLEKLRNPGSAGGADGKPMTSAQEKSALELGADKRNLKQLTSTFKDEYAGGPTKVLTRAVGNTFGGAAPADAQEMARWWADQAMFDELPQRHALFGSALTPTESKSWASANISPNTSPSKIRERLAIRQKIYDDVEERLRGSVVAGGRSGVQFDAAAGRSGKPAVPSGPVDFGSLPK